MIGQVTMRSARAHLVGSASASFRCETARKHFAAPVSNGQLSKAERSAQRLARVYASAVDHIALQSNCRGDRGCYARAIVLVAMQSACRG